MQFDHLLMRGSSGSGVQALKAAVVRELGPEAVLYPGLVSGSTDFDTDTEAALRRWQAGTGLIADGIAGPNCQTVLGLRRMLPMEIKPELAAVRALFPQTKPSNIVRYLPYVTDALEAFGLVDRVMVLAALATIRAESAGFVPIAEYPSRYNTLPGRAAFSAYEPGTRVGDMLGNTEPGDGFRYRGRGFVQLTGSHNYHAYTIVTCVDLAQQPDLANAPEVAAVLLATFLADRADAMRRHLARKDYAAARRLVNGGTHGLEDFRAVLVKGDEVWPAGRAGVAPQPAKTRKRITRRDPPDLRDRQYLPAPVLLPDVHPPSLKGYRDHVLDQGEDFSCTGYALAGVVNFARRQKAGHDVPSVSPRMLYNLARRYDEYAGDDYDGSSCRGALKGWFNHGVCLDVDWPDHQRPKYGYAQRALQTTLGVYYRIDRKSVTDMQAAIVQAHAIYVSAFTHEGWEALEKDTESRRLPTHDNLPLIEFDGRPSKSNGHAFAIVGYNARGFIVQNSWGRSFGIGGFAILGYGDWLANGMDAWVSSLGVPGVVEGRLAEMGTGSTGMAGTPGNWWQESRALDHSIVIGNDGRVGRYVAGDELTRTLLNQACAMPDKWFRTDPLASTQAKKRVVIYAHGGLNSEKDAVKRSRAMGRYFTGNGCYPLFLVWKTGLLESLGHQVEDWWKGTPQLAGGVLDKAVEITDTLIEKSLGRWPGRGVWKEMKENARFSCTPNRGCDLLASALQNLAGTWGDALEIHLVGHSAGSIILGYFLEVLAAKGLRDKVAGVHLYAPACTVQFANRYYGTDPALVQRLWLHMLADGLERDDNVAALYRKSLLYLVSNALEPDQRTPLLGMEKVLDASYAGWDGSSTTMEALGQWRDAAQAARLLERIRVLKEAKVPVAAKERIRTTHSCFDNSIDVVSGTLKVITGGELKQPVDDLRGF
ncbi:MAG: peptidase C1 [Burkholderiales bacterium]|nr:peptidase C1 [Burkholderiales bacterium]